MVFTYNDTLLLISILHSDRTKGTTIRDIVSYFDYVDHSILNYEDFKIGIEKLVSIELVQLKEYKFYTGGSFNDWWDSKFGNKKQVYVYKEIELVLEYLNTQYKESDLGVCEDLPSLEDYRSGVNEYLKKLT
jgi:hypothetical protein